MRLREQLHASVALARVPVRAVPHRVEAEAIGDLQEQGGFNFGLKEGFIASKFIQKLLRSPNIIHVSTILHDHCETDSFVCGVFKCRAIESQFTHLDTTAEFARVAQRAESAGAT